MYDLVLQGNLVLPDSVIYDGYLAISGGRITAIADSTAPRPLSEQFIEARGCWVLPGGIDTHVHAYSSATDPEGFGPLTRSAAAGGLTTVLDMPYDAAQPVTSADRVRQKVELIHQDAVIDVGLYGTISKQGGVPNVRDMVQAGVCAFKVSLFETDPNRFPRIPDNELVALLGESRDCGVPVAFHAENDELINPLVASWRPHGVDNPAAHCRSRPPLSETVAVLKALEMAHELCASVHIVHCTLPRGFELADRYRQEGADISAETCLHYLILSEDEMPRLRGYGKINPPLRSAAAREGLWSALFAGSVAFVTSDHVAWPRTLKDKPNIFDNASGAPGVETLLPLFYSEAVAARGLPITRFAQLTAAGPARRFGLYPRKGALMPGSDADVTVLDPAPTWTFRASDTLTTADWSPFDGMTLHGRVVKTLVRGKTVFDFEQGGIVANQPDGQFVIPRRDVRESGGPTRRTIAVPAPFTR